MPANESSIPHATSRITSGFVVAFFAIVLLWLSTMLSACAVYKKCGISGCTGDAELTVTVQSEFDQHAELRPPNRIRIQVLDHVVYLYGLVDTEFERRAAQSVAQDVHGVTSVVNSISVMTDVY